MMLLRSCLKCRGDLYEDKDAYGVFFSCVQCGWLTDANVKSQGRAVVWDEGLSTAQAA